ncbi:MAG: Smr protein/MutS2 [Candidatus Magasanikbacteria bacterium GW2011_GWD2_43_18]|uniref:Smr protein/MutS2 n=1 Tax=Candidatus Magasanikbacteria bacterium GW2011_GWE2_42_7 TaxID=1619052 RepID=A0A0G1BFP6_9BACT|nr:MAG: Smr protein/MutS2 [Candidatus Magasanikbacteria bacterium GW2011_GWC2_42_27]KKS72210.1 MAG: Smr protein/MutS2 [Candidatus Magasanikbacteria bacterium GW2011_GWE2_42_7]KKT04935.1 MAG: Smr protein/MutS2 [Candidatus Magasanikbacteria bacterium GW2011_GWD2_43_18]KKT24378.1 MAG: Smr protein/MutS2 [Candidatus Magasanikbacteria bacterium GW2011_GWA2_43_9]
MKQHSISFFAASLRDDLPTLDLHDITTLNTAEDMLEHALFSFSSRNESACRIIHGIGSGVMKERVHAILEKNPLVEDFQLSSDGGSTLVLLSSIR